MSVFNLNTPFPYFSDLRGTPLDSGSIYIGEADKNPETDPIQVYWDEAKSIPAAQPLKTVGGYITRNGTPAQAFMGEFYSITVRDKSGQLVFSNNRGTEQNAAALLEALAERGEVVIETDGRSTGYDLPYVPPNQTQISVFLDGNRQVRSEDYTIEASGTAASGFALLFVANAEFPFAAMPDAPMQLVVEYNRPVGEDGFVQGDDFATRAAAEAWRAAGGTLIDGESFSAAGLRYKWETGATMTPGLADTVPIDATIRHFKLSTDADDTAAITAAIEASVPLDWENNIYAVGSQITATLTSMDWKSNGAKILYTGSTVARVLDLTVALGVQASIKGQLIIDGGDISNGGLKLNSAAAGGSDETTWPSFWADGLVAQNFRDETGAADVNGIFIPGGWRSIKGDGWVVRNCHAADVTTPTKGTFGITLGDAGTPWPSNIYLTDFQVENVWSEKVSYVADQDAVRIFQEVTASAAAPDKSRCTLDGGDIRNVANRAIKLHSAAGGIVTNIHIDKDDTVVPQTTAQTTPDIDCQQAGAIVSNITAYYRGRGPDRVINNYTERDDHLWGGGVIDNVRVHFSGGAGAATKVLGLTGSQLTTPPSAVTDSNQKTAISNVVVKGDCLNFLSVNARDNGVSSNNEVRVSLVGCHSDPSGTFITFPGDNTLDVVVSAMACSNEGSLVDLSDATGSEVVNAIACSGFNEPNMLNASLEITQNNPTLSLIDSTGGNETAIRSIGGTANFYNDNNAGGVSGGFDFRVDGTDSGDRVLTMLTGLVSKFYGDVSTVGTLGVGTDSPARDFEVTGTGFVGSRISTTAAASDLVFEFLHSAATTRSQTIRFGDTDDADVGAITYSHNADRGNVKAAATTIFSWDIVGVRPGADDTFDLGTASFRWEDIYATNTTIQSSDERLKSGIRKLNEAETRVAASLIASNRIYQWIDAVESKGKEVARLHCGLIAQDVEAAFEAEGLDVGRYSLFTRTPITKTVFKTQEIERQVTEMVATETLIVEMVDGVAVQKRVSKDIEKGVFRGDASI